MNNHDGKLWVIYDRSVYRIDRADPRITIPVEWIEFARRGEVPWASIDGEVLTVDADRIVTYRLTEEAVEDGGAVWRLERQS